MSVWCNKESELVFQKYDENEEFAEGSWKIDKILFSIATRENDKKKTPNIERYSSWIHEQSLHAFS